MHATSSSRAAIEAELAHLAPPERKEYLETLGLEEPGLNRVIREGHDLLGLITFLTAGPKEARAWTVHRGATAPQAAGVIHTDFERGFIGAEVIPYDDLSAWAASRVPRRPARCASRAATTSSRTATSATSASTSDAGRLLGTCQGLPPPLNPAPPVTPDLIGGPGWPRDAAGDPPHWTPRSSRGVTGEAGPRSSRTAHDANFPEDGAA